MIDMKKLQNKTDKTSADEVIKWVKTFKLDADRGDLPDFSRVPGYGSPGELPLRNRLAWLRTIPLPDDESFIVMHDEAAVYAKGNNGRYPSDLLGIHRQKDTTRLAVAELKYGETKDNLMYAYAEGLRNLYLHLQGRSRLELAWDKYMDSLSEKVKNTDNKEVESAWKEQKNAWRSGNPFKTLSTKKASLIIIGDHTWGCAQTHLLPRIPDSPVKIGGWEIVTRVYTTKKGASQGSKPYALLPLKNLK